MSCCLLFQYSCFTRRVGLERWQGRTAVVTGASSGIGAAVAVCLADAGLKVIGLARRKNLVDELSARVTGKGSIKGRQCDLADPNNIAREFEWIDANCDGIDLLVNNAGILFHGRMTDCGDKAPITEQQMLSTIDLNFKAATMCTRRAVRSMTSRDFAGHVVIVNSIAGHYVPKIDFFNVYPATKHALTAYCTSLVYELTEAKSMIKVTSLSPGLVATDMADSAEIDPDLVALNPSDVASAVLYVIGTPPHVNITELTIEPVSGKRL